MTRTKFTGFSALSYQITVVCFALPIRYRVPKNTNLNVHGGTRTDVSPVASARADLVTARLAAVYGLDPRRSFVLLLLLVARLLA